MAHENFDLTDQLCPVDISSGEKYALKKKAVNGVFVLAFRRVLLQVIQTVTGIILARILFPSDFGIYVIISVFVNIFTLIADVGLGSAIIQKEREASEEELQSIFTVQIVLGILASILMLLLSPFFLFLYKRQLGGSGLFYLQISAFAIIFYNLKLIPLALLERAINYNKILIAEVFELLFMQGITIFLAFRGFGFASFIWALLLSRFFSAIVFFFLRPWRLGFRFSYRDLSSYFSFGYSYQITAIVSMLSGAFIPLVIGGFVGTTAAGLLNWAAGVAAVPRVFSDILSRLIFPLCANIRHDRKLLQTVIEHALFAATFFSYPAIAMLIVLSKPVTYIVFTDKWKDGISSLFVFSLATAMMLVSELLTQILFALGKEKIAKNINILWMSIVWILGTIFVYFTGFIGYPIAWLFGSMIVVLSFWQVKKIVHIKNLADIVTNAVLSFITGIFIWYILQRLSITNILELIAIGSGGFLFYLILSVIFQGRKLFDIAKSLIAILNTKPI